MPPTHTILIILGALLFLSGIVGGGFSLKKFNLPTLKKSSRILAFTFGVLFIVAGIYLEKTLCTKINVMPMHITIDEEVKIAKQKEQERLAKTEKQRKEWERLEKLEPVTKATQNPIKNDTTQITTEATGNGTTEGAAIGSMNQPAIDYLNKVDELVNEMEKGSIAFNAPSKINIEDSPEIHLILNLNKSVKEIKKLIVEEGEKIGASVKISDKMEARLSGNNFQISAITPEVQAVSRVSNTEWRWGVHPIEPGNHKLHLTLAALIEVRGHLAPRTIRTFDRIIEVEVTPKQKITNFIKNNWKWLWVAILVPVVGWFWKRKKKTDK